MSASEDGMSDTPVQHIYLVPLNVPHDLPVTRQFKTVFDSWASASFTLMLPSQDVEALHEKAGPDSTK